MSLTAGLEPVAISLCICSLQMWSNFVFTYAYFMIWLLEDGKYLVMRMVFPFVLLRCPEKFFFFFKLLLFIGRKVLWFSHPCICEAGERGPAVGLGT